MTFFSFSFLWDRDTKAQEAFDHPASFMSRREEETPQMTWTTIIWVGVTNPRSGGKSTNISKYHVAYYIRTFIVNLYGRREREREGAIVYERSTTLAPACSCWSRANFWTQGMSDLVYTKMCRQSSVIILSWTAMFDWCVVLQWSRTNIIKDMGLKDIGLLLQI